jgi:hypothetical protein
MQWCWSGLKKILKPSFSSSWSPEYIKDKVSNVLVSQEDQFNRFTEHYEEFTSDKMVQDLNENYWKGIYNYSFLQESRDIIIPISMSEIYSTVISI